MGYSIRVRVHSGTAILLGFAAQCSVEILKATLH